MRRRRRIAVGLAIVLVLAGFTPDLILRRELAAARDEGLWTTPEEIQQAVKAPDGDNAAFAIRAEAALDREGTGGLQRQAAAAQRARLARWRRAVALPRLDFGRDWNAELILHPEYGDLHRVLNRFLGAALSNVDRRDNLVAAARLCRLLAEDPGTAAFVASLRLATRTLAVARKLGERKIVEEALGPPPSLARALRSDLVETLNAQHAIRRRDGWETLRLGSDLPWEERVGGIGPFATYHEIGTVRQFRAIFRDVRQAQGDLAREEKAFLAHLPAFEKRLNFYLHGDGPYRLFPPFAEPDMVAPYLAARR